MGKSGADVAVLHPLETAYGLFRGLVDPDDESNRAVIDDYDNTYYRLIAQLYSSQIGFRFADLATIDTLGKVSDGRFCVGKMSYGTLVIADIEVLTEKTYALISEFAKNGGKVYIKGDIPCRLDGKYAPELREIISAFETIDIEFSHIVANSFKISNLDFLRTRLKSPPLGGGLGWGLVFNRIYSPLKVRFRPV